MTNEEAIKNLNKVKDIFYFGGEMDIPDTLHTLNISIEALEENDKLKTEKEELELENVCANHAIDKLKAKIEQLKERLEIKDNNFELYSSALEEIEQLKAELEQSVKLQNVLSKLLKGSEFARCYMCDNSMKNITLDGKNNGCDGSCYHANKYTEKDLLDKIKRELDRTRGKVSE